MAWHRGDTEGAGMISSRHRQDEELRKNGLGEKSLGINKLTQEAVPCSNVRGVMGRTVEEEEEEENDFCVRGAMGQLVARYTLRMASSSTTPSYIKS
eukprot:12692352-Ditylum_brightwellii.AAC.1